MIFSRGRAGSWQDFNAIYTSYTSVKCRRRWRNYVCAVYPPSVGNLRETFINFRIISILIALSWINIKCTLYHTCYLNIFTQKMLLLIDARGADAIYHCKIFSRIRLLAYSIIDICRCKMCSEYHKYHSHFTFSPSEAKTNFIILAYGNINYTDIFLFSLLSHLCNFV